MKSGLGYIIVRRNFCKKDNMAFLVDSVTLAIGNSVERAIDLEAIEATPVPEPVFSMLQDKN